MIEYEVVRSSERLAHIAQEIETAPVIGLDIETTTKTPLDGVIRLVQLNTGKGVYVIDLFETHTLGPVVEALRQSAGVKIIQNAKFEQRWFLALYSLVLWPLFDTFRASWMIHNGKNLGHNLYDLYQRELKVAPEAPDMGGTDWSGSLTKQHYDYAAEDVLHLFALRESLKPKVAKAGLNRACLVEFGAIIGEAEIENNGFRLDADRWLELAREHELKLRELQKKLDHMMPHPRGQVSLPGLSAGFNLRSNQQVLESLRRLGLKLSDTREETLAMISAKHPVVPLFMEYRKISKRLDAFGPEYLRHIHPKTGRVHTDFWPLTGAGRYSSRDPNLQQIPRGKAYRSCFAPGLGKKLVVSDYSQIELRIAAEVSRDATLLEIYKTGEDAHRKTASIIADVALDLVTKEQRQAAKPVNFGLIYGLGPEKLVVYSMASYGVAITLKQAEQFIQRYFEGYAGVKRWHERALRDFRRMPCVRTLSGRLRYLDPEKAHGEVFNCLDDQTEALTLERGWVPGFDLSDQEHLLTKNQQTGILEWQPMTALKKFPEYEGPLYEFRSRSFNAVTTPDHRWLVYNKGTRRNEERTSQQLSPHGDHRIHRTGFYVGCEEASYSDDFVELVGWFLTDGCYELKGDTRPTATLYQSDRANPHKVELIDLLMERMDVLTGRYFYPKHSQVIQWRLHASVSGVLHDLFPERVLTFEFIRKLTREQAILLVRTMMLGDGHEDAGGKRSFASWKESGADAFQALCVLAGIATTKHYRDMRKYEPQSEKLSNIPKDGDIWYVTLLRRDKAQVRARQTRVINAARPIWCPVVPNTFFVARREGQVFITGNTPVQGTGADGLKASLPLVYKAMQKYDGRAKMVHMVHDEIVVEVDDEPELVEAVKADVAGAMRQGIQPFLPHVPVVVEPDAGDSWAAHG